MTPLVNFSKISPPTLPKILYRPRLQNLLQKHNDKKSILILGRAAQGKTTLAASYLKTSKTLGAWITLEKEDSNPFSLFYSIVNSLQQVLKEIDFSHLLSPPLRPIEEKTEISLFREWTSSLFGLISSPLQIVLDGLERLSPEAPAFHLLKILVEDAPRNVHWCLISRENPPPSLGFEQFKIRQEAFLLTDEDLAFSPNEIGEFFRKIRKISFDADQLKRIHLATEGWIGGLILLGEALNGIVHSDRGKFISEELPPRFQKEVFQFFVREIFSSRPERVQKFLIKSSMVDLVEPGFMREFIGADDAEEILQELVRKNLFVHSVYTKEKNGIFRYHQSFRDFLQVQFKSEIQEEERQSLLLKAGYLYEKRGDLENAVKYFLEAKAYSQAGSVIAQVGMDLLQSGRKEELTQWIQAFPEEFIQENPWLLFYRTLTGRYLGGREHVLGLQKAYGLFKQKGDRRGILTALAHLIQASIYTGIHLIPLKSLIKDGEGVLQSSEMNEYPRENAILSYFLGLGHILGDGDIRRGILACQNAYLVSRQVKDLTLQGYALSYSVLGWILVGEFSLANEACRKLENLLAKIVLPDLKALIFMMTTLSAYYQGDFARAHGLLERLQGKIEKYGFISITPWVYEISGYLSFAEGALDRAEEIGKQYLSLTTTLENDFFKAQALKLLGMVYLDRGEFGKAREFTEQSFELLTRKGLSVWHIQRIKVLLGLVGYHLKDYSCAERKVKEALEYFKVTASHNFAAQAHFVLALLKWDQGKSEEAASHLQAGFKIAEEWKYDYFLFLGLKYLTQVCVLALELKVDGAKDYATHLLSTRLSSVAEKELKKVMSHPDGKVREKAWEIRRKIHRSQIPILRIETLGGFKVFRGDSSMAEEEWDRNQPKKLLKAILSHDAHMVPKEVLIEDFWPEEMLRLAEEKLKITLSRLRKSLEPVVQREFGYTYVRLHDNYVYLDPELCKVDVDQFLSLLSKGEETENRGDREGALSAYAEAMEIYKGDFLPEEIYSPWADLKREKLKGKYIEFLNRMAVLFEKQGAYTKAIICYKRAVQTDPLLEEAYRSLMILYSGKGMVNEALRSYEACKKAIARELNSEPDPLTNSLYQKILEKLKPVYAKT